METSFSSKLESYALARLFRINPCLRLHAETQSLIFIMQIPGLCSFDWKQKLKMAILIKLLGDVVGILDLTGCFTFLRCLKSIDGQITSSTFSLLSTLYEVRNEASVFDTYQSCTVKIHRKTT